MEFISIANYYIFLFSILLIAGVLAGKFSDRLGVPSLVLFIGVGMVLGSDVLNLIYLDDPKIVQLFGILALIIILFEGGFNTKFTEIQPVLKSSISLATIGVVITSSIIGLLASYVLQISILEGLLLGAIVGSTDAAAVFGILAQKKIKEKLKATLEAESGVNDPMAVFLTTTLISILTLGNFSFYTLIGSLLWQMGFGLIMGLALGKVSVILINRVHLSGGLYPIFALGLAVFTYSLTSQLNGSGFLAVYIYALILGNSDLAYRNSIAKFHEGFALMMQILMFIALGLLVFPKQLPEVNLSGLILSFGLMFIARPIGVFLSTIYSSYTFNEKLFISWTGLRGAIPIILATYMLIADIAKSDLFFNVVFFVVLTSALIQGLTINPLARKLKLDVATEEPSPISLELTSIGKANADIIEILIAKDSQALGKSIQELQLPKDCVINCIVRNNKIVAPRGKTVIQENDTLFVLCYKELIKEVKSKFFQKKKS